MKTEMEKMRSGELYSFADPEVRDSILRAKRLCVRLQTLAHLIEETEKGRMFGEWNDYGRLVD